MLDIGVIGPPRAITPAWSSDAVAAMAGFTLKELAAFNDRGKALGIMAAGAAKLATELQVQGKIDGILGMGGTGGTSVIASVMRELPFGFPKVFVSTTVSGDVSHIVGTKDIVLVPSIVDVAGLNAVSKSVYARAAGALCGMIEQTIEEKAASRPVIAVTMFGNTTPCVERSVRLLNEAGYECLVFHCTGAGGRTMESLCEDGRIAAVLDLTTTEWADELCGGVFSAGESRLKAPGRVGIPHLIAPGCIDMVNFGPSETLPARYRNRLLYEWNANVTLMRTNEAENRQLGGIFAGKANAAKDDVAFLVPLRGYSILGMNGERFHEPRADHAFVEALQAQLNPAISIELLDMAINDEAFADRAVETLLAMLDRKKGSNR